jgi:hypothetical protein
MPNDRDKHSDHAQNGGSRILKNLSLLTLPWLALQLEILEVIKKGMEPTRDQGVAKGAGAGERENRKGAAGGRQAEDKEDENRPKDAGYILIKPFEHLVERQVHALMMILDRSQQLRSRFGPDFEKKIVDEFANVIEKLATGSVNFIEVQETILKRIIETLKALKNDDKTKTMRS